MTEMESMQKVKVRGQKSRSQRPKPKLAVCGLQFEFTDGYEMMHKAWCSIEEVPYCFSRSSVKFQGHMGQKVADFDPNSVFLGCNFILISQMAMEWYTKLEVA